MIRCHLSTLMGTKKMKIIEVARETSLNRSTIRALYKEDWVRVERETLEKLCELFHCSVGDLFEYVPDMVPSASKSSAGESP